MNPLNMFFTADLHFGHKAMPERFRTQFASIESMDDLLIHFWNRTVPQEGHVFVLGDFSFAGSNRTAEILRQLNGTKYLVKGNHDKGLSKWVKDHFAWVKDYHEHKVDYHDEKRRLIMSHYPMRSWNMMHHGSWQLHGHCHNNLEPKWGGQLDVGVDSAFALLGCYRPFSFEEVRWAMALRGLPPIQDHHRSY